MSRDILLLDELTGKVHEYHGVGLSKAMLCDCPLIEESYEANKLTVINREYLEHGIWQKSYCLQDSPEEHVRSSEEFCNDFVEEDKEIEVLERMREMREENEETYRKMGGV